MSVPPFVPHHCLLSWHPSRVLLPRGCGGREAQWALVRELSRLLCDLSKHLAHWVPVSGAVLCHTDSCWQSSPSWLSRPACRVCLAVLLQSHGS